MNNTSSGGVSVSDWLALTKDMNVGAYSEPTSSVTVLTQAVGVTIGEVPAGRDESDPPVGKHIREATEIIKEWRRK